MVAQAHVSEVVRRTYSDNSPQALTEIYQPEVNMAVWQRAPATDVTKESQRLCSQSFSGCRVIVSEVQLTELNTLLPVLDALPSLRTDIQLLAEMFCCLFGLDAVGIRLVPLRTAMCPKFHVDRIPCRLVTSYFGAGTEWLPHSQIDRNRLGGGNGGLPDAESGVYKTADAIRTLGTGDVALLKGELWHGNEGAGLVHRSPVIETGQTRLLLTLDFV